MYMPVHQPCARTPVITTLGREIPSNSDDGLCPHWWSLGQAVPHFLSAAGQVERISYYIFQQQSSEQVVSGESKSMQSILSVSLRVRFEL